MSKLPEILTHGRNKVSRFDIIYPERDPKSLSAKSREATRVRRGIEDILEQRRIEAE